MPDGANIGFSLEELEALFKDDQQTTPPANDQQQPQGTPPTESNDSQSVDQTKSFAHRLKQETEKIRKQERDAIAAELGYQSYEEMQKAKEKKLLEDKGLNPEDVAPVVDELVQKRLNEDPRMKELEMFKQKQVEEFAKKELSELSALTGTTYTSLDQLPKDVVEDWKKTGSLKRSYISLHGEELIVNARKSVAKGETSHLQEPGGTPPPVVNKRPLTADEKKVWKLFNPDMSDEELNKKTIDI